MTMEIGSIFEIDIADLFKKSSNGKRQYLPIEKDNNYNSVFFNSGRSAIEALMRYLKKADYCKVYLPSFICDSVTEAILRAGLEVKYYKVNTDLSIAVDELNIPQKTIFYVVQFFGQQISKNLINYINKLKSKGVPIVEDISLSLLSSDDEYVGFGDFIIGSLRKWFPIPDGGILLSKQLLPEFCLQDSANNYTLYYFIAQTLKKLYLKSHNPSFKKVFWDYNQEGMKTLFQDYTLRKMSKVSMDLYLQLNINYIRRKRIANYDNLYKMLLTIPPIKILVQRNGMMTPMGMVILSERRDELFEYLISKNVYCNIHWRKNQSIEQYEESKFLSERCLTIPCDQRYSSRHMQYIFEMFYDFYNTTK